MSGSESPFARVLLGFAPHLARAAGAVFTCAAAWPGRPGTWERRAVAAIANASTSSSRHETWELEVELDDDEDEAAIEAAHARVGRWLLSRRSDATPMGETTVGAMARALSLSLTTMGHLALLQAAFGLHDFPVDSEQYTNTLGPAVVSRDDFAAYLVGFFGANGGVAADELALVIRAGAHPVPHLLATSEADTTDALDAWLSSKALPTRAKEAAKQALVAVGMRPRDAAAIVALAPAPRRVSVDAGQALPLPNPSAPRSARRPKGRLGWAWTIAALPPVDARARLAKWVDVPAWLKPLRRVVSVAASWALQPITASSFRIRLRATGSGSPLRPRAVKLLAGSRRSGSRRATRSSISSPRSTGCATRLRITPAV